MVDLVELREAHVTYGTTARRKTALRGVDLGVRVGETHALVGESGSGKSTALRSLLRLETLAHGSVHWDGNDVTHAREGALRPRRRLAQPVFQDPHASLHPRLTVARILAEPLDVHGLHGGPARAPRVEGLLSDVGLSPEILPRHPHELSGGQRQRVALARSLAVEPRALLLDEPVSALDDTVAAQVLNLLVDLRERHALSYLFVTHDLVVARRFAQRVSVLYAGRIVETGPAADVLSTPAHPYTALLLQSVPVFGAPPGRTVSDEAALPAHGCPFWPRCERAVDRCRDDEPALVTLGGLRAAACHLLGR